MSVAPRPLNNMLNICSEFFSRDTKSRLSHLVVDDLLGDLYRCYPDDNRLRVPARWVARLNTLGTVCRMLPDRHLYTAGHYDSSKPP